MDKKLINTPIHSNYTILLLQYITLPFKNQVNIDFFKYLPVIFHPKAIKK